MQNKTNTTLPQNPLALPHAAGTFYRALYRLQCHLVHNTTVKALILSAFLPFAACGPVNRFTQVKKVPREYSLNYCGEEIKAPKTDFNKEPWIVFSDRENNRTFLRAGGKVKAQDAGYLDPFLVIKKKGDFLRLVKYEPDILKNGKLEHRKAEYSGWVHKSKLLAVTQSQTDIASGKKNKMLVLFSGTTAILDPEKYFTSDSIKTFKDPELKTVAGNLSPYSIVYPLKISGDGKKTLVSGKPYLKAGQIKEDVLGWVDNSLIRDAGTGLHVNLAGLPEDSLYLIEKNGRTIPLTEEMSDHLAQLSGKYKTVQYAPVSSYSRKGEQSAFRTRILMPLLDRSDNYILNVDGEQITYKTYRALIRKMKKINISFVLEGKEETINRLPQIINALQNIQPLFAPDGDFSLSFNSVTAFGNPPDSVAYTNFNPDYFLLINYLSGKTNENTHPQPVPASQQWPALHKALELLDNQRDATNLIVLIGETGGATENIDTTILRRLAENNCRIAAFQIYAGKSDRYNNFILNAAQMISATSGDHLKTKRKILVTPGQIRKTNLFKESDSAKNTFHLDFPDNSIEPGLLSFPKKSEELPMEILSENMDTIISRIKQDNQAIIKQLDHAFNTSGKNRTRFDHLFASNFELETGQPPQKLLATFTQDPPGWYLPSGILLTDTPLNDTIDFHLMLSELEMNDLKEFIKTLSAVEVEIKDKSGEKKKKKREKICNCPEDDLFAQPENKRETWNPFIPPEYANTRKVRKNIFRRYTQSINDCKLCEEKGDRLKSMSLSEAQRRITGSPSYNRGLTSFYLSDIKDREKIPDEMLDRLVNYFKQKAGELEKAEPFESNGETYYWVKRELLP
ncbi:MAG: hypothetical protein LBI65_04355 [Candidatus Symbiothrix sp.]|jgi:hypothetical protein|nr:hypothetical protein [Candidatus Symbiothrix sp.]